MSFDQLTIDAPDASYLLKLFAYLNPDGILVCFLEDGYTGLGKELRDIIGDRGRRDQALYVLD